jgi:hypothetical protein
LSLAQEDGGGGGPTQADGLPRVARTSGFGILAPDSTANPTDELSPSSSRGSSRLYLSIREREDEFPTLTSVVRPSGTGSANANSNHIVNARNNVTNASVGKSSNNGRAGSSGRNGQIRSKEPGGSDGQSKINGPNRSSVQGTSSLSNAGPSSSRISSESSARNVENKSESTSVIKKGKGKGKVSAREDFPSLPSNSKQSSRANKAKPNNTVWGQGEIFPSLNNNTSANGPAKKKKANGRVVLLRVG